jgi:hypothetical protein
MLLEAYDRPTLAWLTRLVTKGSVMFDIGAHVGYHTLAMAKGQVRLAGSMLSSPIREARGS